MSNNHSMPFDNLYLEELGGLLRDNTPSPRLSVYKNNYLSNIFGQNKNEKLKYKYSNIFFSDLYNYYENFGLYNIILKEFFETLSLIFGIFFILFTFSMINWGSMLQCKESNIKMCGDIFLYINFNYPNLFITSLVGVGSFFILLKILVFLSKLKYLRYISRYYESILEIDNKTIQITCWKDIIKKISKDSRISIESITNIILKNDNYYIALLNNNIININTNFYTKQLDFMLKYIIFNNLENIDAISLRKKFIFYGFVNLILSPFIFIYLCMYLFVSYIDDFYYNTDVIGSRRYSLYAKWKFRQYNELPHFFNKRINISVKHANEYISQFRYPSFEIIAKFISILSGGFVGLFIILSILDESILIYVNFLDRSLIFYAGIIGAISSYSRNLIKSTEKKIYDPNIIMMENIYKYTLYMPNTWENNAHTYEVRDEFLHLFRYIIVMFFYDLISVITTPIILIFTLPKRSFDIAYFIKNNTLIIDDDVGKICSFSSLYVEDLYNNKKMERSIYLFKENHYFEK